MKKESNFGKFLLLWAGELISSIGGGLTAFGLGVYIYDQTGSAANMALVTLLGFLPTLLLSVPAGILADRFDRRLMMMIGDGCSALGIIYILICMMRGGASLTQICIGITISAIFSALLEPSYRATITDLLTKEEFSKANGLVSLAGSARYLFSPVIAGFLLAVSDVKLLLLIDACTFFLTVISAAVVRKSITANKKKAEGSLADSFKEGWQVISKRKGIKMLILMSSLITMFMGVLQVLVEPFVLSFSDPKTLGIAETVCACGMLVSALYLGIRGIKNNYSKIMAFSLMLGGVFMAGFGLVQNIYVCAAFGFLFFMMLPVTNNCIDYLARTNIPSETQGRVWGFIGTLSQMGYVVAYAVSGVAADELGRLTGGGVGKGASLVIMIAGVMMAVIALAILPVKSIRELEGMEKFEKDPSAEASG